MVLSYYILKIPYTLAWHFKRWTGSAPSVVFYCGTELDLTILEPVQRYLKPLPIVVKDKKLQKTLRDKGVESTLLPSFPRGVVMARHAAYKFPADNIRKICLSHGAYNFKRFASAKSHNMLDAYFFTSQADLDNAREAGITSGVAIGYPKLDRAFDGSISLNQLDQLVESLGIDRSKPTILFTATWDQSGISAIARWYDQLEKLTPDYNVLVTVHPWTSEPLIKRIKETPGVLFAEGYDILPHIMLSDVCVGDTSSVLGECCALDKPLITFRVKNNKRTVPHVIEMIMDISWRIDTVTELFTVIPQALEQPDKHKEQRAKANQMMFDTLDGKAGKRAADVILGYFPELKPDSQD